MAFTDLSLAGRRFGRLTVISLAGVHPKHGAVWNVLCNRRTARRLVVDGRPTPVEAFARRVGLKPATVCDLLNHGWSVHDILSKSAG